jgi:hypothetical protein
MAGLGISSPLRFRDDLMMFRDQLAMWLEADNMSTGPGREQAPVLLSAADKAAMRALPGPLTVPAQTQAGRADGGYKADKPVG